MARMSEIPPELADEMTPGVRAFVDSLLQRIADLEARLGMMPQNSSPPFVLRCLKRIVANVLSIGFVVYGVLSAVHQDKRTLATGREEVKRFQSDTSFVPFGAILAGKQQLAVAEYNRAAFAVSAIVFILLRVFHERIFGGFGA